MQTEFLSSNKVLPRAARREVSYNGKLIQKSNFMTFSYFGVLIGNDPESLSILLHIISLHIQQLDELLQGRYILFALLSREFPAQLMFLFW